ncbi:Gfo/Idh/MocA family protein [Paraburkholderia sp. HP33-1]|uniref:Gfo/Idh/MocA family protein n=1 Tax=Paraburkholderia sp. HP33-1 TaxID=2883243 RepID=UPI001F24E0FC|nr:Gfo/Idh/MocA family oxidoreductase [Paraburkholderia sp. HP33-1]
MTETSPMKVGIVGAGNISATYVANLQTFDFLDVRSICAVHEQHARAVAQQFDLKTSSLDDMLSDSDIELIVNLTTPLSHYDVTKKALLGGKHVYSEKPLGVSLIEADELMSIARARELRLGCAPDTFLGGGHQLTRRLYDEGGIGEAISATAMVMLPGHETWHPNPGFFYGPGGGPMMDVGPYYLTNLVALLGPVKEVLGSTKITRVERKVKTGPRVGDVIKVLVPTHVTGIMQFHCGATVSVVTSFDVLKHKHNPIELYGSRGSMLIPDPNEFTGNVEIFYEGAESWEGVHVSHPYIEGVPGFHGLRGIGAAEMVAALRAGRPHRASAELAFHVLEVMSAFEQSSSAKKAISIESTCGRPTPISANVSEGGFD